MIYRKGQASDFQHIETFVWQAIFPAYDHPDLNEAQRASNDAIVETARAVCTDALQQPDKWVLVAYDEKRKELAAYGIVWQNYKSEAQLLQFIVARRHWSKGVAQQLFTFICKHLEACSRLLLSVHYYNTRAIAFFEKQACLPTEAWDREAIIPQIWLQKDLSQAHEQAGTVETIGNQATETEEETSNLAKQTDWFSEEEEEESQAIPEEEWKLALEELLGTSFEEGGKLEEEAAALACKEEALLERNGIPKKKKEEDNFTFHYSAKEGLPLSWPKSKTLRKRPKASVKPISFEFVWEEETTKENIFASTHARAAEEESPSIVFDSMGGKAKEVEWDIVMPSQAKKAENKPKPPRTTGENREKHEPQKAAFEAASKLEEAALGGLPSKKALRSTFRELLYDFANRLFGSRKANKYVELSETNDFELLVENAFATLLSSLQTNSSLAEQEKISKTVRYCCEELAEYLIVGFGTELHHRLFPEALLRYQGSIWGNTDLFGMVNTYLDLESEYEVVYRDFITMPSRKLRNATQNFLLAGPKEVIYFIVDQSLLGNASNGFACTNRSLYWKNPLQPNHAIFFSDLESIKIASSCLWINGHFFDAGYSINLKLALLLEKIRRMQP